MTEYEAKLAADLFEATRVLSDATERYEDASRFLDAARRELAEASRLREEALFALRDYRPEKP